MHSVARNFALVTGSKVLDGAVRLLTLPLLLHHFGRVDFGLIGLAFTMQMFLTIADFGLGVNAVRRFSGYLQKGDYPAVAALARCASFYYTLLGGCYFVALLVVGWFGGAWFGLDARQAGDFFWMMAALGVSGVVLSVFSIYRPLLQAASQTGWDEAVNLTATAVTVLAIGATLALDLPVPVYFVLVLLPALVPTALRVRRVMALVPGLRLTIGPDWALFRPMVSTGLWLFVLTAAEMLAGHVRLIILARATGLESVADFRVVQQLAGVALLVLTGVASVVYPLMARLDAANDQARIDTWLSAGSRLLLWGCLGGLITTAFLSEWLLRLYVGAAFVHLAPALALWLVSLIAHHNAVVTSLVVARGRLGFITIGAVMNAAVSLLLLQHLAGSHGVLAAVGCHGLFIALQLAVLYLLSAPAAGAGSGLRLIGRVWTRPLLCATASAAMAVLAVAASGWGWWAGALVFAALFAVCAFSVGAVERDWALLRKRQA